MASLHFDGFDYDEADLEATLRDAAHGFARTDHASQEGDAAGWASRLVAAALGSSLAEAAGRAVGKLLLSDDPREVELGAQLQLSHKAASGADTLLAMQRLHQQGARSQLKVLATAMTHLVRVGRFPYTKKLRRFADDPDARDSLMKLFLTLDRTWVKKNVATLLPSDPAQVESVLFWALRDLDRSEIEAVQRDLGPALSALPPAVAQAVSAQIAQALGEAGGPPQRRHFKNYAALIERFTEGFGRESLEYIDTEAVRALKGEERAEAVEVLREHLASFANDPRAVEALVALRPSDLLEQLRRIVKVSLDETGVAAARNLWRLYRDPAAAQVLVQIMRDAYDESARRVAALALQELPEAKVTEVQEVLLDALDHESEDVRSEASQLLLRRAKLGKLADNPASKVSRLYALILSPLRSVWRPAMVELKEILAAVHAGQKPAELGLVPAQDERSAAYERFDRSVMSPEGRLTDTPIDTDAIAALEGEERLRAEQILYHLLSEGDARAVHAIRQLRLRAAIPVLEEAAKRRKGRFAKLAKEAAAVLSTDAAQERDQS